MSKLELNVSRLTAAFFISGLILLTLGSTLAAQTAPARTPSETVREFYKALYEKRFREALGISIYKSAIDGLTPKEFDEFKPEFEAMALGAERVEITGEQISGDTATVFVKVADDNGEMQLSKVGLMRADGKWIVGEAGDEKAVKAAGKEYFFNIRILAHEADAAEMFERIVKAEFVHGSSNNGTYADMSTLVNEGLLPKDIEGTISTGYRYRIKLSGDKKSYTATAEPAEYGRSGRLSFYLDAEGLQRKDVGGKTLVPEKK
jgi:hypothetical protein